MHFGSEVEVPMHFYCTIRSSIRQEQGAAKPCHTTAANQRFNVTTLVCLIYINTYFFACEIVKGPELSQ